MSNICISWLSAQSDFCIEDFFYWNQSSSKAFKTIERFYFWITVEFLLYGQNRNVWINIAKYTLSKCYFSKDQTEIWDSLFFGGFWSRHLPSFFQNEAERWFFADFQLTFSWFSAVIKPKTTIKLLIRSNPHSWTYECRI